MSTLYDPTNPTADAIRRQAEARRIERYAAKFRADTIGVGDYREPTDENLAAVLQVPSIIRKARPEEFPAIRAAVLAWSTEANGPVFTGRSRRPLGASPVWDDRDMRARYLADQGWSAEDISAVLGR